MSDDREQVEGVWRALSSATTRRDAAAILAAAGPAMAVGLLQDCGTGVLVAISESAPGVEAPAAVLAQALVERGWDGDAVLADLITHSLASTPTGRQPLPVDVGELADVIEGGSGGWLNMETGIAWPQEIIDDGALEDIPSPEEEPDRWLKIGMCLGVPADRQRRYYPAQQGVVDLDRSGVDDSVQHRLAVGWGLVGWMSLDDAKSVGEFGFFIPFGVTTVVVWGIIVWVWGRELLGRSANRPSTGQGQTPEPVG